MFSVNGIWTTVRLCEAAGWAKVSEHVESGLKLTDLIVPEMELLGEGNRRSRVDAALQVKISLECCC